MLPEPLGYNATDEIELNTSDEEILVNPEIGVAFDTFETGINYIMNIISIIYTYLSVIIFSDLG